MACQLGSDGRVLFGAVGKPLRCHLYLRTLGQRVFRLLVPRARDGLRLSTNRYHDTWHVLCAPGHIRALRRLFWATAFDRHEHTMVVLSGPLLCPTPFDSIRSYPVIIACSDRAHLRNDDASRLLRGLRPHKPPECTVKLQTFGLDHVDSLGRDARREWHEREARDAADRGALRVDLVGGAILMQGSAAALRAEAASLLHLERALPPGDSNYDYVGNWTKTRGMPGEVQVFADYEIMLRDAKLARERLSREAAAVPPDTFNELVCEERARRGAAGIRWRRRQARRQHAHRLLKSD